MRIKSFFGAFEYFAYFFSITVLVQALSSFAKGIYVNYKYNGNLVLAESSSVLLRESKWLVYIISYIAILILFYYTRSKSNDGKEIIKCKKLSWQQLISISLIGIAEVIFFGFLLTFFQGNTIDTYHVKAAKIADGNIYIRFVAQVLFAPIVEEIVFRSCMLERFRRILPTALSIILSSFIFGIVHGGGIHFAYTLLSGGVMALLAIWTKSIYAPILHHMAFNFMGGFHNMQVQDKITNSILCAIGFACIIGGMVYVHYTSTTKIYREQ